MSSQSFLFRLNLKHSMIKGIGFFIALCLYSLVNSAYAVERHPPIKQEIQLLIDVSGSMKQNDPKNLRIPAIKLLVNLLPEGITAGIWLFAENSKQLVKTGVVNKKWKQSALSQLRRVHSSGLFTNIEDVIQKSTQHWFDSATTTKRNLILLTDGMVDISKDIMLSAESRERVLSEIIPKLQQADIHIQTIALSNNADAELLDKLAFDTNGWSETAETAAELQKIFFKLFKKAVPIDTVPINGNSFSVDASIKEFSVLIFKRPGAAKTKLISPDASILDGSSKSKSIAWLNEKNYDLITVQKPLAGDWKIAAEMDGDNQVMIVTDLKFKVDDIENHILADEPVKLSAFFTDQDQLISRKEFLSLIDLSLEHTNSKGVIKRLKIPAVINKPGLFERVLQNISEPGLHTLKLLADGKTFKREVIKTFNRVSSPLRIEIDVKRNDHQVILKLIPDENVLNTSMMFVQATISQPGTEMVTLNFEKIQGKWELVIDLLENAQAKTINFSAMTKTIQGNDISPVIKPIVIDQALFKKIVIDSELLKENSKPVSVIEESFNESIEQENRAEKDQNDDVEEEIDWKKTLIIVLIVNIICIVVGYLVVRYMKKSLADKKAKLLNRLSE